MGNNASMTNIVNSLTENISTTVIETIQVNRAETTLEQSIILDCSDARIELAKLYADCIKTQCPVGSSVDLASCGQLATLMCSGLSPDRLVCSATDIDMKAEINLTLTDEQRIDMSSKLENKIKETITNTVSQEGSAIPFSDTNTYNNIKKVSRNIADIILSTINELSTIESTKQQIVIRGGGKAQGITKEATKNIFSKRIQDNKVIQSQLNDLITSLDNKATQTGGSFVGFSVIIFVVVVGIIMIMFTFGIVKKMISKKGSPTSASGEIDVYMRNK